ncbi:hypothetical protein MNBD_GAMMA12-3668 [hydrothermal vent metagenome]|uniref:Uncharacterized protein n=1 Tax=hydrothermal vent metagenome TaxID=652676 RepID=A0A3B0Y6Q0_9ZZZZ
MSAPSLAERYSIISKDAFKAKRLLATLRSHHIKFGVLLSKRSKIEAWEKSLKLSQMTLDKTFKEASEDQQNVKNAKLSQDDFNLKWKATGRIDKTRQILVKFQSEIIHYNKFRLSYNTLANELKGFLHNRSKTEDLTDLMYKMQKLMLALELAFKNQQYDKAVLLVSKSDIAKEFGYKKK